MEIKLIDKIKGKYCIYLKIEIERGTERGKQSGSNVRERERERERGRERESQSRNKGCGSVDWMDRGGIRDTYINLQYAIPFINTYHRRSQIYSKQVIFFTNMMFSYQ